MQINLFELKLYYTRSHKKFNTLTHIQSSFIKISGSLLLQDATQGNIRFNRAGNQQSMGYASNGKLNFWLNDFSVRPKKKNESKIEANSLTSISERSCVYLCSTITKIMFINNFFFFCFMYPVPDNIFIKQYWPCLFTSYLFRLHKSNISILSVANK